MLAQFVKKYKHTVVRMWFFQRGVCVSGLVGLVVSVYFSPRKDRCAVGLSVRIREREEGRVRMWIA